MIQSLSPKCIFNGDEEPRRVIVFDLYGTLVDWASSIRSFLSFYTSRDVFDEFLECDIREVKTYRPYSEILAKCLSETLHRYNIVASTELIGSFILHFAKSPPFPDTIYGLTILKREGYKLAILSNTERRLIDITLYGFRELLDHVVTAEDVGLYKPHLEAFERAYRRIGVEPGGVIHVSAYPQYDLEPASKLGAITILVNRGYGYQWPISVNSLIELADLLRSEQYFS